MNLAKAQALWLPDTHYVKATPLCCTCTYALAQTRRKANKRGGSHSLCLLTPWILLFKVRKGCKWLGADIRGREPIENTTRKGMRTSSFTEKKSIGHNLGRANRRRRGSISMCGGAAPKPTRNARCRLRKRRLGSERKRWHSKELPGT